MRARAVGSRRAVSCALRSFARWYAQEPHSPNLRWEQLQRVRDMWPGKLILKGILDPKQMM
ncbi:alpha-hydroxy-acid oxidizing protein [Mesorhizobium escarrei]|uniref:alpha-hydroxy-acid oxidizing protein n=1 Tax=Mesorhizobium escarrei TaxID=666018 RepID=UPI00345C5B55